jgi:hypothetical protein
MQAGREIKFRMWDFENQEMIDGDSLAFEEYAPISHLLSRKGIMQYTGFYDKHGREIYEGDIWLPQGCDIPRVIVWHRYGWWFQYPNGGVTRPMEWTEDGEVIGNIYENPELLEVGK